MIIFFMALSWVLFTCVCTVIDILSADKDGYKPTLPPSGTYKDDIFYKAVKEVYKDLKDER